MRFTLENVKGCAPASAFTALTLPSSSKPGSDNSSSDSSTCGSANLASSAMRRRWLRMRKNAETPMTKRVTAARAIVPSSSRSVRPPNSLSSALLGSVTVNAAALPIWTEVIPSPVAASLPSSAADLRAATLSVAAVGSDGVDRMYHPTFTLPASTEEIKTCSSVSTSSLAIWSRNLLCWAGVLNSSSVKDNVAVSFSLPVKKSNTWSLVLRRPSDTTTTARPVPTTTGKRHVSCDADTTVTAKQLCPPTVTAGRTKFVPKTVTVTATPSAPAVGSRLVTLGERSLTAVVVPGAGVVVTATVEPEESTTYGGVETVRPVALTPAAVRETAMVPSLTLLVMLDAVAAPCAEATST
mmetsp:Transcript_30299/g.69943  ORF Transcript_30299/g.69943 Transcript_30299/m.69943 type:complete len:354 (+) Transcript_30299:489-1550(+)